MAGYCAIGDVEARVQLGAYSTTTVPTLAQVTNFIEQRAGEIFGVLANVMGTLTPGPGTVDTSTPKGQALFDLLELANALGASMDALEAAGAADAPRRSERVTELAEMYKATLENLEAAGEAAIGGAPATPAQAAATHISTGQSIRFTPTIVRQEEMTFDKTTEW